MAQAQPWAGFGVEANAIAGKVYRHEKKFTLPIPALTTGFDLNLLRHTYGKKKWHQRRNYPTLGIGITYLNYGIDSIYGRCFGLYPNITIPLITGKKLEWTLRVGDGIGYVTKTYSRVNPVDTINVAIGAHINDFAMFMSNLSYHINPHWNIQLGAHMTHISNASFRKPNLGINMWGANIGISYYPVTSRPAHIVRQQAPLKNRWLIQARLGYSQVSSYTAGGPLYPVYIATGYVSRRWLGKNKLFGGLDYSYHENVYAHLVNNRLATGQENVNSYKSAVFAGNEFLFGRVGIVLQAGVYVKQAYLKLDPFYQKIGGNYYLVQKEHGPVKELFLSVFLKAHKSVAEFGEIGLGIGF